MQSSNNSLIVLSISAVVAVSAIGASPAMAEAGSRLRPSSAAREATQAGVSEGEAKSSQAESSPTAPAAETARDITDSQRRTESRFDRLQTENEIRQQINQSEFRHSDSPVMPAPTSLEMQQQIQQQINLQEVQNDTSTSPSSDLDRLQFEQRVRQRLRQPTTPNEPEPPTLRQPNDPQAQAPTPDIAAATEEATKPAENTASSTNSTDEPQSDQNANADEKKPAEAQTANEPSQPNSQSADETSDVEETSNADAVKAPETAPEATDETADHAAEPESDSQSTPAKPEAAAKPESETAAEPESETAEVEAEAEGTETAEAEATEPEATEPEAAKAKPEAEAEAEATESSETPAEPTSETATEAQSTESRQAETEDAKTKPEQANEADSAQTAQADEQEEEDLEDENSEDSEDSKDKDSKQDSEESNTNRPRRTTSQAEDRIDRLNRDYTNDSNAPAPEYLDPDPNPLSFPTQTEEVEIVGTQPLTLKQAIELAIRNNPVLREEQLTLERTQAALRESQAINYPTLDASLSFNQSGQETVTRNSDTAIDPTTGEEVPSTSPVAGELSRQYTDTATALGAGLELSYPIYTSGRRPAIIRSARGQVRFQQLELERQTEELILDTTEAYYDLQEAGARVNIFTANLDQAEQSLRDAQALERAGVGTRFDVLQAEVDVANARQDLTQQLSQLEISRRQLAQQLNISESLDLAAADPVEVTGVWDLSLPETIVQAYKNRAELEQQLIQREISQQNRRAALAQLGPQLAFQGTFDVTNNLDTNAFFDSFGYRYGLALQVSQVLFDGGEAKAQADQEESNISIAESEFERLKTEIRFQVEQAYSQLDANFANIQTTALAVEQAAEALRLARLRFQAGVGTQTDVLRQQSALAEAQVNNLSAILDYNRAIANLQRQVSNYPEGYLNDQP